MTNPDPLSTAIDRILADIIQKNLRAAGAAKRTIVKRAKPFARYEAAQARERTVNNDGRTLIASRSFEERVRDENKNALPARPATVGVVNGRLTQAQINDIAKTRSENFKAHRNAPQPAPLRKATELPFDAWMIRIQTGTTATVYITTNPGAGAVDWRATTNYDRLVAKLAEAEKVIEPDTDIDAKGKTITLTNEQVLARRNAKRLATYKSLTAPTKLPKGVVVVRPMVKP